MDITAKVSVDELLARVISRDFQAGSMLLTIAVHTHVDKLFVVLCGARKTGPVACCMKTDQANPRFFRVFLCG